MSMRLYIIVSFIISIVLITTFILRKNKQTCILKSWSNDQEGWSQCTACGGEQGTKTRIKEISKDSGNCPTLAQRTETQNCTNNDPCCVLQEWKNNQEGWKGDCESLDRQFRVQNVVSDMYGKCPGILQRYEMRNCDSKFFEFSIVSYYLPTFLTKDVYTVKFPIGTYTTGSTFDKGDFEFITSDNIYNLQKLYNNLNSYIIRVPTTNTLKIILTNGNDNKEININSSTVNIEGYIQTQSINDLTLYKIIVLNNIYNSSGGNISPDYKISSITLS